MRAAGRGRQSGMREEAAARHGAWQHVRRRRGCPPKPQAPGETPLAPCSSLPYGQRQAAGMRSWSAEEPRPGRGGRNVAGGIRVVCLRP